MLFHQTLVEGVEVVDVGGTCPKQTQSKGRARLDRNRSMSSSIEVNICCEVGMFAKASGHRSRPK